MESLQRRLYNLTQKRGVIPDLPLNKLNWKFFDKLQEELNELIEAYHKKGYIDKEELADCFIVICNTAERNSINIEEAALEKATKDVDRKKR